MKKRAKKEAEEKPKVTSLYTIKLDDAQMEKVRDICDQRYWERYEVNYARFAFKGPKLNVVGYESGKLVLQGKDTEDFIINTLEPEVTKEVKFGYDEVLHPEWYESHAGMDESGKGDFFGTVVAACVIADRPHIEAWIKEGIRDSKKITDSRILKLDKIIRDTKGVVVKTAFCSQNKYNELMGRPKANLNRLLGWLHAKALEQALSEKKVKWGLLDQFSKQDLVGKYFKDSAFELRMRTHAEEDPVVAAASVIARAEYVRQMGKLSKRFGDNLQKGASGKVKEQALQIIEKFGVAALADFSKLHFRTAYEVVKAAGKLEEFPLPEPKESTFRR
jgi:ribonuclease HIII